MCVLLDPFTFVRATVEHELGDLTLIYPTT